MANENLKLIVPINVEALCIGNILTAAAFYGATADFSALPRYDKQKDIMVGKPYIHESINCFAGKTLEVGVHLHWALPDALTRGIKAQDSDTLDFPAAPNRWLITRLHQNTKDPQNPLIDLKSWVIESDYVPKPDEELTPYLNHVTIPDNSNDNQYFNYLGKVYALEDYAKNKGNGSSFKELTGKNFTVIGYGEISFAAYYPNCRNVFGFYDNLKDLENYDPENNQITYTVSGWYSDNTDDPLSKIDITGNDNVYKWSFNDPTETPKNTICNGIVQNIKWNPNQDYFNAEKENEVEVAVGNTLPEALSALIANEPALKDQPNVEYLLNALQIGLISKSSDHPDWPAKLEEEMHLRTFAFFKTDTIWVIKNKNDSGEANAEENTADKLINAAKNLTPILSEDILYALHSLNTLQTDYYSLAREIDTQKTQIYLDWYKYIIQTYANDSNKSCTALQKPAGENTAIDINALRDYLNQAVTGLNAKKDRLGVILADENKNLYTSAAPESLAYQIVAQFNLTKKLLVDLGTITKENFADTVDDPQDLLLNLSHNGYINQAGEIQDKFIALANWSEMSLDAKYEPNKKEIFFILENAHLIKDAYILTTAEGPRFWQANDPVMLLSGADVKPSIRYGGDDRFADTGYLPCRLANAITSQVSVLNADNVPFTVGLADLVFLPNLDQFACAQEFSLLLAESVLINPSYISLITSLIKKKGQTKNPAVLDFQGTVARIKEALTAYLGSVTQNTGVSFSGTAPLSLALNEWQENPWIPLFLNWAVDYYPTQYIIPQSQNVYPKDFMLKNYEFSANDTDWVSKADNFNLGEVATYSRTISLNKNVFTSLKNEIDTYLKNYDDDEELKEISEQLQDMPILAQALNGFNQALLMQEQEIQLDINDPFSDTNLAPANFAKILPNPADAADLFSDLIKNGYINQIGLIQPNLYQVKDAASLVLNPKYNNWRADIFKKLQKFQELFNNKIRIAAENNNTVSPMPLDSYNPIRGGFLKISGINLIDAFGRGKQIKIADTQFIKAQNLTPTNPKFADYAYLAPRITQPSRLQFKWLSANYDAMHANSHNASSPICGWLLTNFLENNLIIYDNAGKLVGILQLNAAKTQLLWFFAPVPQEKAFITGNDAVEKIKQNVENIHLQDFIINLLQKDSGFFVSFMQAMEQMLLLTEPGGHTENQGQSLFVSRPLVLARASLQLELYGNPDCEQSWQALNTDLDAEARTTRDFEHVKFPINLGAPTQINDGLIGYFLDKNKLTDYSTFYTKGADAAATTGIIQPANETLQLDVNQNSDATCLTMIMDPFGTITAFSGILPAKSIALPPNYYTTICKNICLAVLVAPILYGNNALTIPVAKDNNHFWSLFFTNDEKWDIIAEVINSPDAGILNYFPQQLIEGWLKLNEKENQN